MSEVRIARLAGLLAVLAGVVLSVWAWLANLQPVGCIGDGCDTHPMRTTPVGVDVVFYMAGVLLVASVLAVGALLRERGTLGRAGAAGCGLILVGGAVLLAGVVFGVLFPGPAESAMPGFVIPGFGAVVLGLLLVAFSLLRARVLPTWAIALLAAAVVVMVFANEENWRVLLIVPFAAAWAVAGALLARGDGPGARIAA